MRRDRSVPQSARARHGKFHREASSPVEPGRCRKLESQTGTLLRAIAVPPKEPECKTVGDEKHWHQDGRNEVSRALQAWLQPNACALGLVERVEQICRAENVACPHQHN